MPLACEKIGLMDRMYFPWRISRVGSAGRVVQPGKIVIVRNWFEKVLLLPDETTD
jgi:hypothetical protein